MECKKILFFGGIPLVRIALVRRANVLAKKLIQAGYNVILSSVASNYYQLQNKNIVYEGLPIIFFGQAHFLEKGQKKIPINIFKYFYESLFTVVRVINYLKKNKINNIVLFTTLPVSLLLLKFLNRKRITIYYDIDDLTSEQWESNNIVKKLIKSILSYIEKHLPLQAYKISSCSHYLASFYPNALVIPNMVEQEYFKKINIKQKYGLLKKKKINIIFLSEIGPYHGHKKLIKSIYKYKDQLINKFHFYFIGGGLNFGYIKNQIKKLLIHDMITMTGRVEFKRVIPFLNKCSIGIIPMEKTNVNIARNPLKLFEYMLSYTIVIANPTYEIKKVIKNKKTGFLTKNNTTDSIILKLIEVYKKKTQLKNILLQAYSKGMEYSSSNIMKKWMNYFEFTKNS